MEEMEDDEVNEELMKIAAGKNTCRFGWQEKVQKKGYSDLRDKRKFIFYNRMWEAEKWKKFEILRACCNIFVFCPRLRFAWCSCEPGHS